MKQRIWLLLLVAIGIAIVGLGPTYAIANPENWNVNVGGESSDMSIQGLGFYPGIITVNEGDNITWTINSHDVHTVSFLTGEPPMPGSPESLSLMGGTTFDGSENVSSGIMNYSSTYTLTFTKNGTYLYRCLIHSGMTGVVIVNPAGTPYPEDQQQVTSRGADEFSLDSDVGTGLRDNLVENVAIGSSGNKIFNTDIDIPLPTNAAIDIVEVNNSKVSGSANLDFIEPGQLQINITLSGLEPNSTHPAHICIGSPNGPILYTLNNITADQDGNGVSTTLVQGPPWFAIAIRGWFINVHEGPTMDGAGAESIASGEIVKNDAALLRFTPKTITINKNDEVDWKQLNYIMIHTVSFLEKNQTPPPVIMMPGLTLNPDVSNPAGGNEYNGSGFFNSGTLIIGNTYNLTFTQPGTYNYWCLLHGTAKMMGTIKVLSNTGNITGRVINDTNGNGRLDKNETGLEGWIINLLGVIDNESKVITDQTTTDANGTYMFGNLAVGRYYVSEQVQQGFIPISAPFKHVDVKKSKIYKKNFYDQPEVASD